MYKNLAFIIAVVFIGLGFFLVGLNIMDIAEGYRLNWPIAVINTVFISALAVPLSYFASRAFTARGSSEMLGLGIAVLAFGFGILLYSWFTRAALEVRIRVYDISFLMAGIIHFGGVVLSRSNLSFSESKSGTKRGVFILSGLVVVAVIAAVFWLLYQGVLPLRPLSRGIFQGLSAVLCLIAAFTCLKTYLKSHRAFYYWYSLGLVLFAFGQFFIVQGPLESPVAWLGRTSQYTGGIYLLVAVLGAYRPRRN